MRKKIIYAVVILLGLAPKTPSAFFASSYELENSGFHSVLRVGSLKFIQAFQPYGGGSEGGLGEGVVTSSGASERTYWVSGSVRNAVIKIRVKTPIRENIFVIQSDKDLVTINDQEFSLADCKEGSTFIVRRDGKAFHSRGLAEFISDVIPPHYFRYEMFLAYTNLITGASLTEAERHRLYLRLLAEGTQFQGMYMRTDPVVAMFEKAGDTNELIELYRQVPATLLRFAIMNKTGLTAEQVEAKVKALTATNTPAVPSQSPPPSSPPR